MCVISDSIKFCTCISGSIKSLDSYWIIYRLGKVKEFMVLGMPVMPQGWGDENYEYNRFVILERLNQPDAFDKALDLKNNDKLHIVFNSLSNTKEEVIYAYKYKKNKWVGDEYDCFELENHNHKQIEKGRIEL